MITFLLALIVLLSLAIGFMSGWISDLKKNAKMHADSASHWLKYLREKMTENNRLYSALADHSEEAALWKRRCFTRSKSCKNMKVAYRKLKARLARSDLHRYANEGRIAYLENKYLKKKKRKSLYVQVDHDFSLEGVAFKKGSLIQVKGRKILRKKNDKKVR